MPSKRPTIEAMEGMIFFDKKDDLPSRVISAFRTRHNSDDPVERMERQCKYVGVTPRDGGT